MVVECRQRRDEMVGCRWRKGDMVVGCRLRRDEVVGVDGGVVGGGGV